MNKKSVDKTIDYNRLHVLVGETVGNLLALANRSYYYYCCVRCKRWLYVTQCMMFVPFIDIRFFLSFIDYVTYLWICSLVFFFSSSLLFWHNSDRRRITLSNSADESLVSVWLVIVANTIRRDKSSYAYSFHLSFIATESIISEKEQLSKVDKL